MQADSHGVVMSVDWLPFFKTLIASVVYSFIGIALFALSFILMNALSPFSIRKEIEEDHNTALAILMGAVILGLSFIISAAIGG